MADFRERVAAFLNEKWQGPKTCPVCRSNAWVISDKPSELREHRKEGFFIGGPVYPLVVLTCRTCGHTLLFNAIVMGAVDAEAPKQSSDSQQGHGQQGPSPEEGKK